MLSSKDAIADVVEEIKGVDFYRPGHELIFNTITDLYGRGDPADTVTTADELDRRGELERAGHPLHSGKRRCALSGRRTGVYEEQERLGR